MFKNAPSPKTAACAAFCCAVLALGSACGTAFDPSNEQATSGSESAASTQLQPLGTAELSPKSQRPSTPAKLVVTGVRVGTHEGFDRVVVDLEGLGEPGWFVDYTSTPIQETTGQALNVSGNAFLNINVDGTVLPFEDGKEGAASVDVAGGTGNVVDVITAGTYEGRSQIVVGLRSELPFSVQMLEDPTRVVVDIVQS